MFDYDGSPMEPHVLDRRPAFHDLRLRLAGREGFAPVARRDELQPTGLSGLDDLLAGGLPAGALIALEGGGSWSLVAVLLAQATARGLAAAIDDGSLYPPALSAAGVDLPRLLVVQPPREPLEQARAADLLLRPGCFALVTVAAPPVGHAVWQRLAALCERSGSSLLVVDATAAGPQAASPAAVRLRCEIEDGLWEGPLGQGHLCHLAGYRIRVVLRKHRRGRLGGETLIEVRCEGLSDGDRLRVHPLLSADCRMEGANRVQHAAYASGGVADG